MMSAAQVFLKYTGLLRECRGSFCAENDFPSPPTRKRAARRARRSACFLPAARRTGSLSLLLTSDMSDIFERFEKEYTALSASVGSKVAALSKAGPADDRAANIATADAELMQADELLQQMELEARSVTAKERPRLQTRLK
eukprot:5159700-Prymnesium_polylepis.1